MREIVAELSHVARRHPQVNQRSGVSVRVSTANYENLVSNALRRALRTGEREAVARVSDLPSLVASTAGKIELETWEDSDDEAILEKLIKTATNNVFRRHFTVQEFTDLVQRFDRGGFTVEVGDQLPATAYAQAIAELPGVDRARQKLDEPDTDVMRVAVLELILEGLHLGKRLNKTALEGSAVYGG
jgi:magnesium chelatase subunit I